MKNKIGNTRLRELSAKKDTDKTKGRYRQIENEREEEVKKIHNEREKSVEGLR